MNDYNPMDKEPKHKSSGNTLEDKIFSKRGCALVGTLSLFLGTYLLGAGILGDNYTDIAVSGNSIYPLVGAGLSYLNAGLYYYLSIRERK